MVSDTVMISGITAIVTLIGTGLTLLQAYLIAKLNKVQKIVEDVHILTNSNFSTQMLVSSTAMQVGITALKRLALITKDPADIEAVAAAEKLLVNQLQTEKEHQIKQAVVDSNSVK